jgi:hypothetical protein
MASLETAKDAHRGNGDVLLNDEQICRPLDFTNSKSLQVAQLLRKFAISTATADALAPMVYGDEVSS